MRETLLLLGMILLAGTLAGCEVPQAGPGDNRDQARRTTPVSALPDEGAGDPAHLSKATLEPVGTASPLHLLQEETRMMSTSQPVPSPADPTIQGWIEQAKEDLAERLGVEVDRIALEEFRGVVWPDGSLGCPQPGMAYTQVPRDGYLIRLRHGKRVFSYHGDGQRPPFLCENPSADLAPGHPPGLGDD